MIRLLDNIFNLTAIKTEPCATKIADPVWKPPRSQPARHGPERLFPDKYVADPTSFANPLALRRTSAMRFHLGLITWVIGRFLAGAIGHGVCEPGSEAVRQEWGSMTSDQRVDYTNAILCMQRRSPLLATEQYPGVQNRMDDFVAAHINYTLSVHLSGIFLAWHRHFIWLWERALRDECAYQGYQPYWDWPLWASDLIASPLFDGSDTSLSGDGDYDPDDHPVVIDGLSFPRGTGGGCVTTGPFKGMELHMGPFGELEAYADGLRVDAFRYNPRCFTRSLNDFIAARFTNQTCVDRVLASTDIVEFQKMLDFDPAIPGSAGVHGSGHNAIGDTMRDFFASPQDPAFMLHHGMIDRLWAMWQAGDINRRHAVYGTSTILNRPTTPPVNLDTVLEFGVLDPPRTMRELMDPAAFEYCYGYT